MRPKLLCFPAGIGTNMGFIRQSEVRLRPRAALFVLSHTSQPTRLPLLCASLREPLAKAKPNDERETTNPALLTSGLCPCPGQTT